MKKLLFLLLLILQVAAANAQPPSINITLPALPSDQTALWGTGANVFNIAVTGNLCMLNESTVLVNIKNGGSIVCGGTTAASAISSGISMPAASCIGSKSWNGSLANSLLNQTCVLPAGTYELCVQFYGRGTNGQENKLLLEKCKPFVITAKEQSSCTAPINVNPTANKQFTETEINSAIIFNWTPFIMARQGIVTYKLLVWEVEEGQNNFQAMYSNSTIIEKDIKGQTRYTALPGSFEKRPGTYVWRVIAVDENGKPLCATAQSEPTNFMVVAKQTNNNPTSCCANKIDIKTQNVNVTSDVMTITQPFNISPVNIKKITTEIISFEDNMSDTSCMKCTSHDIWDYNFIAHNTASWNSGPVYNGSPVNATAYYPSKMIEWHCNKQGNLNMIFKISLPGNKSGCTRKGKICIKYRFEDANCVTCEEVICYDFTAN